MIQKQFYNDVCPLQVPIITNEEKYGTIYTNLHKSWFIEMHIISVRF